MHGISSRVLRGLLAGCRRIPTMARRSRHRWSRIDRADREWARRGVLRFGARTEHA
jgi:hypothetical protein